MTVGTSILVVYAISDTSMGMVETNWLSGRWVPTWPEMEKELTIAKPKPWLYSTVERQFGVVAAVSRHLFISMTYVAISACLLLFV